jgi:hypothetical protein
LESARLSGDEMTTNKLYEFALMFADVAPSVVQINGRLFLDRSGVGTDALTEKIATYADAREAQQWLNLVPIDDLLDIAVLDWSMDDEALKPIADVYRRSWLAIIRAQFGNVPGIAVDMLTDHEHGDVMLRLTQDSPTAVTAE